MSSEQVQRARLALQRGYTVTAAAAAAGVSRKTLYDWLASDEWGDGLCKARARGQKMLERSVLREAKKDGRLALDVLSRRSRAWQKRTELRVDAKVQSTDFANMPAEERLRLIREAERATLAEMEGP